MTVEIGPLDDDEPDTDSLSWLISGKLLSVSVRLWRGLGADSIRYDDEKNRLSIRGESDRAGCQFRGGYLIGLVSVMAVLQAVMVAVLFGHIGSLSESFIFHTVMLLLMLAVALPTLVSLDGLGERMRSMTVYDHTTEPLPDDLDDLKQQFVDGDLDDSEFEAQLEKRLTEVEGV